MTTSGGGGGGSAYGVDITLTPHDTGSTIIVEESLALAMTSPTTIFSQTPTKSGVTIEFQRILTNDGVTRYYRATVSKAGYASAQSSVISSAPYDLGTA